jgi:hypothetical protein
MEVKSFGIHITNVAPGDFATVLLPVVIMHLLLRALLMRFLMESHCERWMMHVDGGSNQMKWLKLFISIGKT